MGRKKTISKFSAQTPSSEQQAIGYDTQEPRKSGTILFVLFKTSPT